MRLRTSGCFAVMAGRAAIGNPWIFGETVASYNERIAVAKEHFAHMIEYYGGKGLLLFRKHAGHYIKGIPGASDFRYRLMTAASENEVYDLFDTLTSNQKEILP